MEIDDELEQKHTLDKRLWDAINENNLDLAEECIRLKADVNYIEKVKCYWRALHIAAKNNNIDAVNFLLLNGANVNATDIYQHTPLHEAALHGHAQVVELLLTKGADPKKRDYQERTPLHITALNGHTQVVESLIAKGVDIDCGDKNQHTPLHEAALHGHAQVVELLLTKGADPNQRDYQRKTLLHQAASRGHTEVVEVLIAKGADIDCRDNNRKTPLHRAASRRYTEVVEVLITKGADIDCRDNKGQTPLHRAASSGHTEVIEVLIAKGADLNYRDINRKTPLHIAALYGQTQMVELLIAKGADIDCRDNKGQTPLHQAASHGHTEVVEVLIAKGADLNYGDNEGQTPLRSAASSGHTEVVEVLISKGADLNDRDIDGRTPLHQAASHGHTEVVGVLIAKGSDLNYGDNEGRTPLHLAALHGHTQMVELLIAKGSDIDCRDISRKTALHIAVLCEKTRVVELLIAKGADIDYSDNTGRTLLHIAASFGHTRTVELLLNRGADPNYIDNNGWTPLHTASSGGYDDTVRFLLFIGADMDIVNTAKKTPYQLAKWRDHAHVIKIYKTYLSKGIPLDVKLLNSEVSNGFEKALLSGFYYSFTGKVLILGNANVGKTCITRILIGMKPNMKRLSTEGIQVYVNRACIDRETKKLIPGVIKYKDISYGNLLRPKTERHRPDKEKVNAKLNEEGDSSNVLPLSNLSLEYDLEETKEKDEKEDSPPESEDVPENEITSLQKIKSAFGIQRDMPVQITSKMMMEGAGKARKRGINLNLAPVIILDFAGQEIFYSTHQSFLTHQGIYVLVINGSLNLDKEIPSESFIPGRHGKPTTRGYIMFWVSSILTYSKGESKTFPQILLCCTHKDKVPEEQIEIQRTYIFDEVTRMFENTEEMFHLVLKHRIFINAINPKDPEITVLQNAVVEMICEQPSWGEKMPKSWIHLEMVINKKVEKGSKVIPFKMVEEINQDNPVKVLNKEEIVLFLQVQHAQGNIIYFPLPGLRDYIVISPSYVIDAFTSIVTDKRFCTGMRLRSLQSMNRDGMLDKLDINIIWKSTEFLKHKDFIICLMCHLDILAEPRIYNPENHSLIPSPFYYVPSMVSKGGYPSFLENEDLASRSVGLSFKFHSTILPSAIGNRFMACCLDMWEVKTFNEEKLLFSGLVLLIINRALMLLVSVKEQRIDAFLIHSASRHQIIPDLAASIRECLSDTLDRISDSYKIASGGNTADGNHRAFHVEFTCNHVKSPCYFDGEENNNCRHTNNPLLESSTIWFVEKVTRDCPSNCDGVSEESLMEKPSELQIGKIVSQLTFPQLKSVLIHLGLSNSEIETIQFDNQGNIQNSMFLCLQHWRRKQLDGTLADIKKALVEEKENTHILCKIFRDKDMETKIPFEILEQPPTDRDIDRIATQVIRSSLLLSVHLGIEASVWLELKEDCHKIVDINRRILYKWRKEHPGRAKCRELAQALCNVDMNIDAILSDVY